ncbi:MAG: hypothetical protein JW722_03355 [Demequinaceae bacterium]|nr:hypothetical protein [Demequinaceae bacterium]
MTADDLHGAALERATRNHGAKPGYELQDGVDLVGWEHRSTWGYDFDLHSFYARLWRNDNHGDAPDFDFSGIARTLPWPECLVGEMVTAMECTPVEAMDALGLRDPSPAFASEAALEALLATNLDGAGLTPQDIEVPHRVFEGLMERQVDEQRVGMLCTALWLLGLDYIAPASSLQIAATPATIMAERHMAVGAVYTAEYNRDYVKAVDWALHWRGSPSDVEQLF